MRFFLPWSLVFAAVSSACPPTPPNDHEARDVVTSSREVLAASDSKARLLGVETLSVPLSITVSARAQIATAERVVLVIEGIELLELGGTFEVFLDPPETAEFDRSNEAYVGELAVFGKKGETPESTRTLDVTARLRALGGSERLEDRTRPLRIVFRSGASLDEGASAPALRVKRLTLEVR